VSPQTFQTALLCVTVEIPVASVSDRHSPPLHPSFCSMEFRHSSPDSCGLCSVPQETELMMRVTLRLLLIKRKYLHCLSPKYRVCVWRYIFTCSEKLCN
jgi:hypothetical protein